jgi:hypothetical protein
MIENRKHRQRLFATDLRGSERTFRKFINARDAYSADILILTGNLSGAHLIPIVKRPLSGWSSSRAGRTVELRTASELAASGVGRLALFHKPPTGEAGDVVGHAELLAPAR